MASNTTIRTKYSNSSLAAGGNRQIIPTLEEYYIG